MGIQKKYQLKQGVFVRIVLLGDSIFDNKIYVKPGELSVCEHLRGMAPGQVTLLAVDGHVTADVIGQLEEMPSDATHLFVSVGGNDALGCLPVLSAPVSSVQEALFVMANIKNSFLRDYRRMLAYLVDLNLPVTVCTIYNCVPNLKESEKTALALFNEVITSEASRLRLPVIDLRHLCNENADYSEISPIEPSHQGGMKIAKEIASFVIEQGQHPA